MFSKSCEYAIRATIFIGSQSFKGNKPGLKDISGEINSPEAFTAKILQLLVKHRIINSHKGPTGGFSIHTDTFSKIKLYDIVLAIDGDSIFKGCALGLPECSENHPCPAHYKFRAIRNQFQDTLRSISIEDMIKDVISGLTFLKI
ncbi:transcriptional regulator, BadM/Rrf2 family [Apibacter mensalis]|uniref:Transcriptional regulator, BadM/Rrf2 family n=1 Tax=Apibacter mensalis TaxID=1586267 RepID=A0A0X8XY65_9FLAO|nr:Rrf2 family transcriptional regulator [Apibacter mensalis]CVK17055.1 transcriptional regulator, BadM/Rrf2 family [Apibacter mensalis]